MNSLCSYAQILISYAYLLLVGPWRGEQPHFPCHLLFVPGGSFHFRKWCRANSPEGMSQFSPVLLFHVPYLWEWAFNLSEAGKVFSAILQLCIYFRVLYKYSSKSLCLREVVENVLQEVTQEPDNRAAAIHSPTHPWSTEWGGSCTRAVEQLLIPKKLCVHFCFHD